jgi:Predicted RNA methylase
MKNHLRQKLTKVKDFENPKVSLEQYITPPGLAADLIFFAYMNQDLSGDVLDLGTGTGILAVGAALTGSKVEAVDKDEEALDTARKNAEDIGVSEKVSFEQEEASKISRALTPF